MDTLYRILYAAHARGSHHKIALRALAMLRAPDAQDWARFFLSQADALMIGAKAPDTDFKDFTNHVLHVGDGDWGGAPKATRDWYAKLVDALKAGDHAGAAYAAGVVSHYYSDPLMPFHTGSSEAENTVHRAVEWSISRCFEEIWEQAPDVSLDLLRGFDPLGEDWVEPMVRAGAARAHARYWDLIAQYDFEIGVKKPEQGLTDKAKKFIAPLLAQAASGTAYLIERATLDADIAPPKVNLTVRTVVAGLKMPAKWVTKRLENAEERRLVQEIHAELVETGRVEETLPEESRVIREATAKRREAEARSKRAGKTVGPKDWKAERPGPAAPGSVPKELLQPEARRSQDRLRVSFAQKPTGAAKVSPLRPTLAPNAEVERAPSIGPKTAARLSDVGVRTVADLLAASPQALAASLARRSGSNWITADKLTVWRDQAALLTQIPGLKATEAVLLVASGHRTTAEIAAVEPARLHQRVSDAAETNEMRRALYEPKAPTKERVADLIETAKGLTAAAA